MRLAKPSAANRLPTAMRTFICAWLETGLLY